MKKFFSRLFEKDLDLVARNDPGHHPGSERGMDNLVALGKAGFNCFPVERVLKSFPRRKVSCGKAPGTAQGFVGIKIPWKGRYKGGKAVALKILRAPLGNRFLPGITENQLVLGTGSRHIHEPPLFLQHKRVSVCPGRWKPSLHGPDNEDRRPFEPFGGVDGGKGQGVFPVPFLHIGRA